MGDVRACLMSKKSCRRFARTTAQAPVVVSCAGPNDIAGACAPHIRARRKGLVQPAPVEVEVVQENSAPLFTAAYSYRTQEYARRRTAGSVSSGQVGSMPQ